MSLIRQLWIAIILVMMLSFGGSFIVSTLLARNYLTEQLHLKNIDNASALALSMAQMPKDPVTVELLISAQFDTGHYEFIRLVDPRGNLIIERVHATSDNLVPSWFVRLIDLSTEPGVAQVQDGWHQFGTLILKSHSRFAHQSLWQGTIRLTLWFIGGVLLTGVVGSLLLRIITRPLGKVVEQAEAIGARRFITVDEPRTLELRTVVSSMNALSNRVGAMLSEEAERLEQLRHQTQHDPLTGLLNRDQFLKRAKALLQREDKSSSGVLVVARITDLSRINRDSRREIADQLLYLSAQNLSTLTKAQDNWTLARLSGSDFALLAPTENDALTLAQRVAELMTQTMTDMIKDQPVLPAIGATQFSPGEELAELLSRVDGALASAEQAGNGIPVIIERGLPQPATTLAGWRQLIETALADQQLRLAAFPVVDNRGALLHMEAPARMLIADVWQSAGVFMPWAARLGLLPQIDSQTLKLALGMIAKQGKPVGINLSAESLTDTVFRNELIRSLQHSPQLAQQLWIEVPEAGAYRNLSEFRALCLALKPLGCKVGLEHVGHQFSRMAALNDLGLDYVKIDASIIRDIDQNPGSQALVRGLCLISHSIGLMIIAEGVSSEAERTLLPSLGIDGMTGPAIRLSDAP